jgi:hypothetical protein
MKLKFGKSGNEYCAGIYTGNGGISSMIIYRQSKKLWKTLGVFKIKYLWVGLVGKSKK